jgi:sugar fermentation stimulation protein A
MKISARLIPATFVKRDNRFRVTVRVEGRPVWAHLPNSGRLRELLVPGRRVLLAAAQAPGRLTSYDLLMVDLDGPLVSIDARLPSRLLYEALRQPFDRLRIPAQDEALRADWLEEFAGYAEVRREVTYGQSRLDLVLEGGPDGGRCFIEAKSVTLVEDGVALFPDAPTQRGRRHLGELARARAEGHRAAVVFVVQRDDATSFSPHDEADPAFGQALRKAAQAGVEVYAYKCRVSKGEVTLDAPLPVIALAVHDHERGHGRNLHFA